MSVITGQVTVPVSGSGSVQVAIVPSGATVSLLLQASGAQVWLGMASSVSAGNGVAFSFKDDPMKISVPRSSAPVTLWALNNSALTPTVLGFIITTTA